ncbi:DUF1127 domain-containing protein [Sulfitobacter mediterraneus]|jgi:uncharacterized protein YjiS (DUF1127 family)|uniref:DUF1127 domain-containing protein n=1 Tax=Sulfitobacter TaxID=60136 RepID=UPI0019326098|nr:MULTISPECIES: DUF1127 domain-containing protein [Sulfitobacter]MBM1631962.1 DUF1127 domain-containing protein [Sulfitobacter mediterraneus]MBM1639777.1 DUF1127 domain-containing protein [Sulfitobacter mediterraneus]MBM1643826.1 DUF1127 domain-containing protein [Sulfitobacter mediterraneus]MBM1647872.1 DUF1127 domain-containing protein [Sulfitobacter mediterraneus]MBM1651917.1 DUF1127 domain-containing protein [Sulfitobacter mediterraneus]
MAHALTHTHEVMKHLNQRGMPIVAILAVKFAVCVTDWATRYRTRQALKQLEPWQLRDVGLTPDQALSEASRVFWKL